MYSVSSSSLRTQSLPGLILTAGLLTLLAACGGSSAPPIEERPDIVERAEDYLGLSLRDPSANPMTPAGIALGRRLFYDPILSGDHTLSCGGCHQQQFAFSDGGNATSQGIHGEFGGVNTPAIVNPGWSTTFFWDGRAPSLEKQALGPVPNPIEMDLKWEVAIERLEMHAEYPGLFNSAFGSSDIDSNLVADAIAQFERSMISIDSRWDRSQRGEITLTADEVAGEVLYNREDRGDCFHCHGLGPIFDNSVVPSGPLVFANNGLDSSPDAGRFAVTGVESDRGKFKVPTLRNIEMTAPYMHDGRFDTLEEVVRFYNTGMHADSPNFDGKLRGNALAREGGSLPVWTETEIRQLVAFLKSLTDDSFLARPSLSDPASD
jgi:cytochrome c peroxidase